MNNFEGMAGQRIERAITSDNERMALEWMASNPQHRRRRKGINWTAIGIFAFLSLFWAFVFWAGTRHWKPKQTPPAVANAIPVPYQGVSTLYRITDQKNRYEVGIDCPDGGDPTVVGNFDGMLIVSCGGE